MASATLLYKARETKPRLSSLICGLLKLESFYWGHRVLLRLCHLQTLSSTSLVYDSPSLMQCFARSSRWTRCSFGVEMSVRVRDAGVERLYGAFKLELTQLGIYHSSGRQQYGPCPCGTRLSQRECSSKSAGSIVCWVTKGLKMA